MPAILTAMALAACSAPSPTSPDPEPAARPNVVLILIDTFRPDHLGINGYERRTAPFLEDLMARSTVFRKAWSTSSWTAPATSSVFTSLYPNRHGVTTGFLAHRRHAEARGEENGQKIVLNRLPESQQTLPELMAAAGYATFGMATNINIGSEIGFDRGFDRFRRNNGRAAAKVARHLGGWRGSMEQPDQPYFLYLHFNDVHAPYKQHKPWYVDEGEKLARSVSAYNSEISYLDQVLGKLYRDFGWDRNTLLVVVSDHGEEFRDHGRLGHDFTLFNELMRVLMVFSGEDLGIPARTIEVDTSLVDVLPTILELVGAPPPSHCDGLSLAPFLGSELPAVDSVFAKRTLFAHRKKPAREGEEDLHMWAAVRSPWKLIEEPAGRRLFQIDTDPGERRNRAKRRPRIADRLSEQLDRFRARHLEAPENTTEVELDRKSLEELEALGYVQ